jgi:hypothetical protein
LQELFFLPFRVDFSKYTSDKSRFDISSTTSLVRAYLILHEL